MLPQLRERGRVSRGYIGIGLTNVTPALQRALQARARARRARRRTSRPTRRPSAPACGPTTSSSRADGRPIQSDDELIRYISARAARRDGVARRLARRRGRGRCRSSSRSGRCCRRCSRAGRSTPTSSRSSRDQARCSASPCATCEVADARRLAVPDTLSGRASSSTSIRPVRRAWRRSSRGQVLLEVNRQRVTSEAEFRAVAGVPAARRAAVAVLVYDPSLKQRAITRSRSSRPQS